MQSIMQLLDLLALLAYLMMQLFQLGLMTVALKADDFNIGIQRLYIALQVTGRQLVALAMQLIHAVLQLAILVFQLRRRYPMHFGLFLIARAGRAISLPLHLPSAALLLGIVLQL